MNASNLAKVDLGAALVGGAPVCPVPVQVAAAVGEVMGSQRWPCVVQRNWAAFLREQDRADGSYRFCEDEGDLRATRSWYAVARGENLPLVQRLVQRGANQPWPVGGVCRDDATMCRTLLLQARPALNLRAHGETPLFYAARLQRLHTLALLIDVGADAGIADLKARDACLGRHRAPGAAEASPRAS